MLKDASDKLGCHLLLPSSCVFPPPGEEEDAGGMGAAGGPQGCRLTMQEQGMCSATRCAGLLAARQGQSVTGMGNREF